ncbi:MAG: four helix bundle suffix domain-containing protein [Nitrospirota bacterium]
MSEKRSDGLGGSGKADDGERRKRLRPSGGYRKLRSFQTTTVIYDATVSFCDRFMDKRSRTVDQMVQAARSGRQNIAEGSRATATSSQTELRLVNVARASLDELLLDFEDFLRQRGLRQWGKDDPEAREVRAVGQKKDRQDQADQTDGEAYTRWLDHKDPAVVANTVICLIHQANYLLDQQIAGLERQFVEGGGYSEQLAKARLEKRERNRADSPDPTDREALTCPLCGKLMALRTARKGKTAGSQFWGCTGYPDCKGARSMEDRAERTDRTDHGRRS